MIPLFTLERQNKSLNQELTSAIKEVIDKGVFVLGKKVEKLEDALANYLGVKHALGVASGTDALSLSLISLGVDRGAEVIVPANAYPTAFAVSSIGAVPKLVDIHPLTYNIDSQLIASALTKKTKAIIAVHMYGQPADMREIMAVARKHNLPIVEDCAQTIGAEVSGQWSVVSGQLSKSAKDTSDGGSPPVGGHDSSKVKKSGYKWEKVGSLGDIGCFSFYPTKNLGCFGDGGAIVTNNEEIYKKIRLLRMYGEEERYHSVMLASHSRLDELQAAILLTKLKYLDKWNERRREIAEKYKFKIQSEKLKVTCLDSAKRAIQNSKLNLQPTAYPAKRDPAPRDNLQIPKEAPDTKHVYHLYVIRTKYRDKLKAYLEKKGIQTAIHYPVPVYLQPSFAYLGYKKGDFPESEKASDEVLSLPMFPELKDEEIEKVVDVIREFF